MHGRMHRYRHGLTRPQRQPFPITDNNCSHSLLARCLCKAYYFHMVTLSIYSSLNWPYTTSLYPCLFKPLSHQFGMTNPFLQRQNSVAWTSREYLQELGIV